jgi:hypothetical protein
VVKLLFLCRRRADVTHERYAALLLEGHVSLALRHHPTMRRYTVNIVEEALGAAPPLDSIAALSFETLGDFRERLYDSPEGERTIARDVAGFLGGADAYATREHVVRAPEDAARPGVRSPGVKLVLCLRRAAEQPYDAFLRTWFERRIAAVLACPEVRGYVANAVEERLTAAAPAYDGIAEVHLAGAPTADVLHLHGAAAAYRVAEYVQR